MSKVKQEILAMLPVQTIQARDTKGVSRDVLVDGDYDGEWFSGFQWRILPSGYVTTYRHERRPDGTWATITTYLHHMVLPRRSGLWVYFINGDKLDCRSANLEYRTPKESAANRRPSTFAPCKRKSKERGTYRGVSPAHVKTDPDRWVALCKNQYLGTFSSQKEAALAYDKKARELWGDRAALNFPEEN